MPLNMKNVIGEGRRRALYAEQNRKMVELLDLIGNLVSKVRTRANRFLKRTITVCYTDILYFSFRLAHTHKSHVAYRMIRLLLLFFTCMCLRIQIMIRKNFVNKLENNAMTVRDTIMFSVCEDTV